MLGLLPVLVQARKKRPRAGRIQVPASSDVHQPDDVEERVVGITDHYVVLTDLLLTPEGLSGVTSAELLKVARGLVPASSPPPATS